MTEAREMVNNPDQPGVVGWYWSWRLRANLTRLGGFDAHRLRVLLSPRRRPATGLTCARCERRVRLIET